MKREPRFDTPRAVVAPQAALMRHFDPARVQGYCQSCENHGRVWSCPPFNNPPMDAFPAWTHAVIVCRQLWLAPGTTQSELLKHFLAARLKFGEWLRTLESRHARTTALIAGQCAACAKIGLLKKGRSDAILDEVRAAVARWPEFAAVAKVSQEKTAAIARAHRLSL